MGEEAVVEVTHGPQSASCQHNGTRIADHLPQTHRDGWSECETMRSVLWGFADHKDRLFTVITSNRLVSLISLISLMSGFVFPVGEGEGRNLRW